MIDICNLELHVQMSFNIKWLFEGNHNADVALGENEFGTPGWDELGIFQSELHLCCAAVFVTYMTDIII